MSNRQWSGDKPPPPPPNIKGSLLAMAWRPKMDPKTGRTFYYNSRTKASVWTLPAEVIEELSKIRCFKCNREVNSASLCPVCLVDPNPDSPPATTLHATHTASDPTPRAPVDPAPKVPIAPVKQAPRRATSTGVPGAFLQRSAIDGASSPPISSRQAETKSPPNPVKAEPLAIKMTNNSALSSFSYEGATHSGRSSPRVSPSVDEDDSKTQEDASLTRHQVEDSGLPAGWIAIQDTATNSLYYFHPGTQEVTWSRPETDRTVVQADLPLGWIAIKDASSVNTYYYNQDTQEVTWEKPVDDPGPPPEDSRASISTSQESRNSISCSCSSTCSTSSKPPALKIRPAALILAKNALVEMKARDSAHLQGLSVEDAKFINEILRPKYGDGLLLKDPALVDTLFVHMINHESLRKVIFCEFFLSCFRHETILQLMLKKSAWKMWLLALISESSFGAESAMLDYVLMTLIEMFNYFFHRYSEKENTILGTTEFSLGISSISSPGKNIVMYDFIVDAALVIIRQASMDVCLRVFSGMLTKIASWGALKPPWATPNFLMPQWNNLFSSLEALEECMFFTLPSKEFYMPDECLFPGMAVVDAIITLLEKLKVKELDQGVETDASMLKLQKVYASKGVVELEFFRGVRDFFVFYSDLGCMEKNKAGFEIKAKPPPRCSQAEFCHLLLIRKRICYGTKSQVQKKVAAYVAKVAELYSKVFAGEIQLAPHLLKDRRSISPSRSSIPRQTSSGQLLPQPSPRRFTLESSSPSAPTRAIAPSPFVRQQSSGGRKFSLDIPQRPSHSAPTHL